MSMAVPFQSHYCVDALPPRFSQIKGTAETSKECSGTCSQIHHQRTKAARGACTRLQFKQQRSKEKRNSEPKHAKSTQNPLTKTKLNQKFRTNRNKKSDACTKGLEE
jgi:hypothetical protein